MRIRAIVFDFNGVIVNDEPLHCYGFQEALKEVGLDLGEEEYRERYLPFDDATFFRRFMADRGLTLDAATLGRLMKRKSEHYFGVISRNIPVQESTLRFIRSLPSHIRLAIASGAARSEIEYILEQVGLRDRFEAIVAAGDVVEAKPHAQAFLEAYERFRTGTPDLRKSETVVIEDSHLGLQSARRAGFVCVGLAGSYAPQRLAAAHLVLESLEDWNLSRLAAALEEGMAGTGGSSRAEPLGG